MLGPGEIVGELGLLRDDTTGATVTTLTPVIAYVGNPREFASLLDVAPVDRPPGHPHRAVPPPRQLTGRPARQARRHCGSRTTVPSSATRSSQYGTTAMPISHVAVAALEVADDAQVRRVVEADEHDGVRHGVGERRVGGVVDDRVAGHRAPRRHVTWSNVIDPHDVADLLGRVLQRRARRAALDRPARPT